MTIQEIADEIDRDIRQADDEARRMAYAFDLGRFPEYWGSYLGKMRATIEDAYEQLSGQAGTGGNQQADG